MPNDLYEQPSRKALVIVLFMLLFVVLANFVDPAIALLTPGPEASLPERNEAVDRMVLVAFLMSVLAFSLIASVGLYFFRLGYGSAVSRRFPPLGATVVLRTRVRVGRAAVAMGWCYIALSAVMFCLASIEGYGIWFSIRLLAL